MANKSKPPEIKITIRQHRSLRSKRNLQCNFPYMCTSRYHRIHATGLICVRLAPLITLERLCYMEQRPHQPGSINASNQIAASGRIAAAGHRNPPCCNQVRLRTARALRPSSGGRTCTAVVVPRLLSSSPPGQGAGLSLEQPLTHAHKQAARNKPAARYSFRWEHRSAACTS